MIITILSFCKYKALPVYLLLLLLPVICNGQQTTDNQAAIGVAFELYQAKEYQKSAEAFSAVFRSAQGAQTIGDYGYIAACSWAKAGMNDSAFSLFDV
ncbi:MAG: hypothetical protein H7257_14160, partial [Taibaiella sp.]|nr:hypothetical protein [Taibaiella sp.]